MNTGSRASSRARLLRMALVGGTALSSGLYAAPALAQLQGGAIQGTVTNKDNGRALEGVTIVVSGPALQGDQSEVSDKNGKFIITQVPPGDNYVVRFYFNDVVVERPGVRIVQSKTLPINISMPTHKGTADKIVVRERAPTMDVASTNTGVTIGQEIMRNTAVAGRTYESVMSLAPGSADVAPRAVAGGDVGVSIAGGTGNENAVLIDGLNTTDLNTGVLATQLHQYFIKEMQVVVGGYQAEYGRATGGVVSILTNNGSNEFHGGVFGSIVPFQAEANTVARLGEALATRTRPTAQQYDFGFDLGGPLVKDRIWFYLGFAPTFTTTKHTRAVRTQLPDMSTRRANGTFAPQLDPDYQQPGWVPDSQGAYLYDGLRDGAYRTVEGNSQQLDETERIYNWIGKLQINFHPDHNLSLGYIGAPKFEKIYNLGLRQDLNASLVDRTQQIHDATARYVGKFFDRKLEVVALYGYHYQGRADRPNAPGEQQIRYRAPRDNPFSLADLESAPDCVPTRGVNPVSGKEGVVFNPCPITDYFSKGYGQYVFYRSLQRHALQLQATLYLKAAGLHAIRAGLDFEDNLSDNTRKYTGGDFTDYDPNNPSTRFPGHLAYTTDAAGTGLRVQRGFAYTPVDANDPLHRNQFGDRGYRCGVLTGLNAARAEGQPELYCYDYFRAITESRYFAPYLRDQWNVSFVPGLVINAGVRWEIQQIFGADGSKQIDLLDNIAPRVGVVYDVLQKGRGKVYANFARFYESIPMDINDRSFSGEGLIVGSGFTRDCATRTGAGSDLGLPYPGALPGQPCNLANPRVGGSGKYAPVAPQLKGQFLDEVVFGGQADVGLDIVIGAYYTYRSLGNVIEDLSVDGGNTYFIANPGAEPNAKVAEQLRSDAMKLNADAMALRDQAMKNPGDGDLQLRAQNAADKADLAARGAEVYTATALFPKAKREYHAGTLTIEKRLSHRFAIFANYTYSRLMGNYPGPFSPFNNQLDPNISTQFDIIDLTVNRSGPLTNDRPHNIKAIGTYQQPLFGGKGSLTASLTFKAYSGRPVYVLGQHTVYGAREVFILPAGSGGRTPMVTQMDLHLGYDHQLSNQVKVSVFMDVLNLFNQQAVTNVDDEYTFSFVDPIRYGKAEDLPKLRATDGTKPILNSNYGQPTAYQQPLFMRFGGRLSF